MNIVAIIPAKGKYDRLPFLNLRRLGRQPVIAYSINAATSSSMLTRVIVSTESDEIAELARQYGAEVPFMRPAALATEDARLSEVIHQAVIQSESDGAPVIDLVVVLIPGFPFLDAAIIDQAIRKLIDTGTDTVLSMTPYIQRFWRNVDHRLEPLSDGAQTGPTIDSLFYKNGAVCVSRRDLVSSESFIGSSTSYIAMEKPFSMQINSDFDLWVAERMLCFPRVLFRVDGSKSIGMGHVYSSIRIARAIRKQYEPEILFLMSVEHEEGVRRVAEHGFSVEVFPERDVDFCVDRMRKFMPNVIVNDLPFVADSYMKILKALRIPVVNVVDSIEDIEVSEHFSDAVVSFLEEESKHPIPRYFSGPDYTVMDDMERWRRSAPNADTETSGEHEEDAGGASLLVTFGGSDPLGLSLKAVRALRELDSSVRVTIVLGIAFSYRDELSSLLEQDAERFVIKEDVKNMPDLIAEADVVLCSGGRTVYEIAALGTPGIVISQNEREAHRIATFGKHGTVIDLGIGTMVEPETIVATVNDLLSDVDRRQVMSQCGRTLFDGRGTARVADIILSSVSDEIASREA